MSLNRKISLSHEIGTETSIIFHFIQNGSKVLFLNPISEPAVNYLIKKKECIVTVFQDSRDKNEDFEIDGLKVYQGNFASQFIRFKPMEFDFIILDGFLEYQMYPFEILQGLSNIFPKIILPIKNSAQWRRRLSFLFSGTLFSGIRKRYENFDFWRDQIPWKFSCKDIINICQDLNLKIEDGIYFNSENQLFSIKDIRNNPNLFADRIVFRISQKNSGVKIALSS